MTADAIVPKLDRRTFLAASAAGAASLAAGPPEARPVPVILDTDLGADIDDTWALLYLLRCPEVDVRLVTVGRGQPQERAALAAKTLQLAGRKDIPIATGPEGPGPVNQRAWLDGFSLEDYPGEVRDGAAAEIVRTVGASSEPVTVCAIGPATNVADALRLDPWMTESSRFVGMAGSIRVGYDGANKPAAEANVRNDPAALRTVLEADWEVSLTPLDTCGQVVLDGDRYATLRGSTAAGLPDLMTAYRMWLRDTPWAKDKAMAATRTSVLYDVVACAMCFSEEWLQMETVPLEVEDGGRTVVNREDGRPTRCALAWRDFEGFLDHLVGRLTGGP